MVNKVLGNSRKVTDRTFGKEFNNNGKKSNQLNIYTVLDTLAEQSGPLYQAVNDLVAIRQFGQLIEKTQSPVDYDLYRLGVYDPCTLEVVSEEKVLVTTGKEFMEAKARKNEKI